MTVSGGGITVSSAGVENKRDKQCCCCDCEIKGKEERRLSLWCVVVARVTGKWKGNLRRREEILKGLEIWG